MHSLAQEEATENQNYNQFFLFSKTCGAIGTGFSNGLGKMVLCCIARCGGILAAEFQFSRHFIVFRQREMLQI